MTLWSPLLGPLRVPAVKSRRLAVRTSCLATEPAGRLHPPRTASPNRRCRRSLRKQALQLRRRVVFVLRVGRTRFQIGPVDHRCVAVGVEMVGHIHVGVGPWLLRVVRTRRIRVPGVLVSSEIPAICIDNHSSTISPELTWPRLAAGPPESRQRQFKPLGPGRPRGATPRRHRQPMRKPVRGVTTRQNDR